ncbi:MAG TPA: GNAT family N-acetyltransferase [Caulobacteraceae bacterium]|jgi:RimJ/RimL family protein N-acetyltransferase|nr:GNAT family N-acetyltransferase [Caulobacteraceae bacterium]
MLDELAPSALQTERLRLRPLAPGDAARLAELANDYDVVKTTGGMPFPYALEDAERFIRRAAEADPAREVHFAVELAGEGPIGCVGFYPPPSVLGPELGYWIGRPYWGRRIASEMLGLVMPWARDVWGQRCVVACHHHDNPASGAALERAGFLYTGQVEPLPCRARGEPVASRWMVWLA